MEDTSEARSEVQVTDLGVIVGDWFRNDPVMKKHFIVEYPGLDRGFEYAAYIIPFCIPETYPILAWINISECYITVELKDILRSADPEFFDKVRKELYKVHNKTCLCGTYLKV